MKSEWYINLVIVPKKDGSFRFCLDYNKLNAATVTDSYKLPRMDDILNILGYAKLFTTLYPKCGYCRTPVVSEYQKTTSFTTNMGTNRYKQMIFGINSAPSTFQIALDRIRRGFGRYRCQMYLNEVIIVSTSVEEHVAHVD